MWHISTWTCFNRLQIFDKEISGKGAKATATSTWTQDSAHKLHISVIRQFSFSVKIYAFFHWKITKVLRLLLRFNSINYEKIES